METKDIVELVLYLVGAFTMFIIVLVTIIFGIQNIIIKVKRKRLYKT